MLMLLMMIMTWVLSKEDDGLSEFNLDLNQIDHSRKLLISTHVYSCKLQKESKKWFPSEWECCMDKTEVKRRFMLETLFEDKKER
jgi:hypothetical protein